MLEKQLIKIFPKINKFAFYRDENSNDDAKTEENNKND